MASFAKFVRPQTPRRRIITEPALDIVEAILRYRFSPTSELVRLVGGNEDFVRRRLRMLWERQLITRFAFPGIRTHSEFVFYLDRRESLELLMQYQRLAAIHPQMEEELRPNRDADYAGAVHRGQHMKLGFLQHSMMISRLHFMLEMASRNSSGEVELAAWRQGGELRGHKVDVPEMKARRIEGSNDYVWEERGDTVRLPAEPDAMFSLRFPAHPPDQQLSHFCYEADRGSMPMADMLKKFRAYYYFITPPTARPGFRRPPDSCCASRDDDGGAGTQAHGVGTTPRGNRRRKTHRAVLVHHLPPVQCARRRRQQSASGDVLSASGSCPRSAMGIARLERTFTPRLGKQTTAITPLGQFAARGALCCISACSLAHGLDQFGDLARQ